MVTQTSKWSPNKTNSNHLLTLVTGSTRLRVETIRILLSIKSKLRLEKRLSRCVLYPKWLLRECLWVKQQELTHDRLKLSINRIIRKGMKEVELNQTWGWIQSLHVWLMDLVFRVQLNKLLIHTPGLSNLEIKVLKLAIKPQNISWTQTPQRCNSSTNQIKCFQKANMI